MTDEGIARTVLDGGLSVLTQPVSGVRSASVGVWVRYGSAHEGPEQLGGAHLLEHMVFKGTGRRSAKEIAGVLERLGGSLDAYTSREHTSFQARVLDDHLELALDVLADMVVSPTLSAQDLAVEQQVVLEEIATVEDTPDDLVFELHSDALWPEHPYGRSILGTRATVSGFDADGLRSLHADAYRRPNLVVAAAGAVDHDRVVAAAERLFAGVDGGGRPPEVPPAPPVPASDRRIERVGTQTHIVLGGRSVPQADPRRYALVLLSSAVGGGMSSRLFQRVREELGLAYSVFTFQSFYRTGGTLGVYVGTRPEWADRAEDVIREELARVAAEGLTATELDDAKGQVKGRMVLDLESPGGRVTRLALQELYDEPHRTVGEMIERIDAVTQRDIVEVADECMDPERWLGVRLGPTP